MAIEANDIEWTVLGIGRSMLERKQVGVFEFRGERSLRLNWPKPDRYAIARVLESLNKVACNRISE